MHWRNRNAGRPSPQATLRRRIREAPRIPAARRTLPPRSTLHPKAQVRTHATKFVVEHGVETLDTDDRVKLISEVRKLFLPVGRDLIYQGLEIVDKLPDQQGFRDRLPDGSFPHEVWIRRGERIEKGSMQIGDQGQGICRFVSDRIPSVDDPQFNLAVQMIHHEFGHVNGLGEGDPYYKQYNVRDETPVPPYCPINGYDPRDVFWIEHASWLRDPMFNPHPEPQWSEVSKRILLGEYRLGQQGRELPVSLDTAIQVRDRYTGEEIESRVFVFHCDTEDRRAGDDRPAWRQITQTQTSPGVRASFQWADNDSIRSSETARLIKVFALGYVPQARWVSTVDMQLLATAGHAPHVDIAMEPVQRVAQQPSLVVAPGRLIWRGLIVGETYVVRALLHSDAWVGSEIPTPQPMVSFCADAEECVVPADTADAFFSIIHLTGMAATPAPPIAPASPRVTPQRLAPGFDCEFCKRVARSAQA